MLYTLEIENLLAKIMLVCGKCSFEVPGGDAPGNGCKNQVPQNHIDQQWKFMFWTIIVCVLIMVYMVKWLFFACTWRSLNQMQPLRPRSPTEQQAVPQVALRHLRKKSLRTLRRRGEKAESSGSWDVLREEIRLRHKAVEETFQGKQIPPCGK